MIFSEEIKRIRKEKKWSKITMSIYLYNVPYPTYMRWENGRPPATHFQCNILQRLYGRELTHEEIKRIESEGVE